MNKQKIAVIAIVALALVGGVSYKMASTTSQQTTSSSSSTAKTQQTSAATTLSAKTTSSSASISGEYDEEDKTTAYDTSTATKISLKDDQSSVEGAGATVSNNTITLTQGGTYILSGKLTNGQIVVNSTNDSLVRIVLNNTEITNESAAAIAILQSEKTIITTAENSENKLATTAKSFLEAEEAKAAIYSKDDLTLNGLGTLIAEATTGNGIQSKDDLKITSGTYKITSENEGLKGKDSIQILDGTFTIQADNDGIQSTNSTETDKGYIILDGGKFSIKSETDGIQAETYLTVNNADITIQTNKSGKTDTNQSYKGLKSSGDLTINGGTFTIDAADDTIHSNANVTINAGKLDLSSGDDGIHADETTTIVDGEITISKSYEGIEGANVIFKGGQVNIKASDDGINAAGGSTTDESSDTQGGAGGPFGQDSFKGKESGDSGEYSITFEGGTIIVDAEGDGLDSNGDITMTDGQVTVYGPTSGGNAALDYDGSFEISGGTLWAIGFADMAQSTSDTSSQASIQLWLDNELKAGEEIMLKDDQGNVLSKVTATKSFSNIVVSDPAIKTGETYTLATTSGVSTSVKVDANVTSIDQTGAAVAANQGMPGGGGAPGRGGAGGGAPGGGAPTGQAPGRR